MNLDKLLSIDLITQFKEDINNQNIISLKLVYGVFLATVQFFI
jgi:hypothetical protein